VQIITADGNQCRKLVQRRSDMKRKVHPCVISECSNNPNMLNFNCHFPKLSYKLVYHYFTATAYVLQWRQTTKDMFFDWTNSSSSKRKYRIWQPNKRTLVVSFTKPPFCKAQQNVTTAGCLIKTQHSVIKTTSQQPTHAMLTPCHWTTRRLLNSLTVIVR